MVCKVKSEYQIIPSACNLSSNLNSRFPAANLEIHLVEIVQLHVHILRMIYSLNGKIKAFKSTICSLNSMAQKCNVIFILVEEFAYPHKVPSWIHTRDNKVTKCFNKQIKPGKAVKSMSKWYEHRVKTIKLMNSNN